MQIFRGEIKIQSRWEKIRIQSKLGKWSRGNFCYIQQWTRHLKCSRHLKKIFSKQSSAALLTLYQRTIFGMQTNEIKLSSIALTIFTAQRFPSFTNSKKNSPSSDKIHCVCPDGHNYLDTEYKFKEEGEISEMMVNYFCLPVSLHFWNLPFPFL